MNGKTTIKDIARHAGVSTATVSNVLNRIESAIPVSAKTREKVRNAASELNWRPNAAARALRTGESLLWTVVVPSVTLSYYAEVIEGIEDFVEEHSVNIILRTSRQEKGRMGLIFDETARLGVDGYLVTRSNFPEHTKILTEQCERGVKILCMNCKSGVEGIPSVYVDRVEIGRIAAEYLFELGHERIAYLCANPESKRGFKQFFENRGIQGSSKLIIDIQYFSLDVAAILAEIRDRSGVNLPTAFLVDGDLNAVLLINELRNMGYRVPEDISVMSNGGADFPEKIGVPLSAISLPRVEMGRIAARLMFEYISGEHIDDNNILRPELKIMGTTARAVSSMP